MTTFGIAGLIGIAFGGFLFILGMFLLGAGGLVSMGKIFLSMFRNFGRGLTREEMDEAEADTGRGMMQGLAGFFGSMGVSIILMFGGMFLFWIGIILGGVNLLQYFQVV